MFEHHPPYRRVLAGEPTAVDRQWLRLLDELLDAIHYPQIIATGTDPATAREVLGLLALAQRFEAPA